MTRDCAPRAQVVPYSIMPFVHHARDGRFARGAYFAVMLVLAVGSRSVLALDQIPFTQLSVEDGLSQGAVHAIVQDHTGYMWFGTQEGLNRYDGLRFVEFRGSSGQAATLSHSWIFDLLVDRAGMIWIATRSGGLNRLDPETLELRQFRHDPNDPLSLTSDQVRVVYEDAAGHLWVGTEGGLLRYEPAEQVFTVIGETDRVRGLAADSEGRLWIASRGGLGMLDIASDRFEWVRAESDDPDGLTSNDLSTVYVDRADRVWVGTYDAGLLRLDPGRDRFDRIPLAREEPAKPEIRFVRAILEDEAGLVWVGTDAGLYAVDPASGVSRSYQHDPVEPTSLSDNRVLALYQGQGGVFWVGTYDGLNKWNYRGPRFERVRHDAMDPRSLPHDVVTAFAGDDEVLWVGTYGGGLAAREWGSADFRRFPIGPGDRVALPDGRVMSLLVDTGGALWVSMRGHGLVRLAPGSERFERFVHDPDDANSLGGNDVTSLYDDGAGSLWIGTYGAGLDRLDRASERFHHYRHDPDAEGSLPSDLVVTLTGGDDGTLWVGTDGDGLGRFDPESGEFWRVRHDPSDPYGLTSDHVWSIHRDLHGDLWVGTDYGLNRWRAEDIREGRVVFARYGRRQGLPSGAIQGIESDTAGRLWISTNRGLSRLEPESGAIKNFTLADGLQGYDFNQGAHYRDAEGRLYFGGARGFNAFAPGGIVNNTHVPPVVLTDLLEANRPLAVEGPLSRLTEIVLHHADDMITFEFAALDYVAPERNRYAYSLIGFNDRWVDAGYRPRATYTNLPAGRYRFRVKASNNDGVWNQAGLAVAIRVLPAPWHTWWAYALYILTVLTIISMYWRFETRRLRQRMELRRREDANAAKGRLLATISHEIRTPMNGVLGMVQLLINTRLDRTQRRLADGIKRSAESLCTVVDDVLDYTKIEAGRVEFESIAFELRDLIEDVLLQLAPPAHRKGVTLWCDMPLDVVSVVVGDPLRIRQIVVNLIGNAIKFTERGEIAVRVSQVERGGSSYYRIAVEDTGVGLSDEQRGAVFEAFGQADRSIARHHGGTGLGLVIASRLVRAIGGEIGVENAAHEGAVFQFTLPLKGGDVESPVLGSHLGRRMLLGEAHPSIARTLFERCCLLGMETAQNVSGAALMEALYEAANAGRAYDLVLIDLDLPGIDGATLARMIAASPDLTATAVLLMVRAGDDELRVSEEVPCAGLLVKPIRTVDLLDCIDAALGDETDGSPVDVADEPEDLKAVRVLLVDDNLTNREIAGIMLEGFGCEFDVAGSGSEALEALSRAAYDLVLMDCEMPDMDGYEATRRLRKREAEGGRRTPIVALTAGADEENRRRCMEAGMDDFLIKPLDRGLLHQTVQHWAGRLETDPASWSEPPALALERDPSGLLDQQVLDVIRSLQRPGQPDLLARVVGIYLEEAPRLITGLREAVVAGDYDEICRNAHSLKSCSAHVGASSLESLAQELERRAAKRSATGVAELLMLVQQNYADATEELGSLIQYRAASDDV